MADNVIIFPSCLRIVRDKKFRISSSHKKRKKPKQQSCWLTVGFYLVVPRESRALYRRPKVKEKEKTKRETVRDELVCQKSCPLVNDKKNRMCGSIRENEIKIKKRKNAKNYRAVLFYIAAADPLVGCI